MIVCLIAAYLHNHNYADRLNLQLYTGCFLYWHLARLVEHLQWVWSTHGEDVLQNYIQFVVGHAHSITLMVISVTLGTQWHLLVTICLIKLICLLTQIPILTLFQQNGELLLSLLCTVFPAWTSFSSSSRCCSLSNLSSSSHQHFKLPQSSNNMLLCEHWCEQQLVKGNMRMCVSNKRLCLWWRVTSHLHGEGCFMAFACTSGI